MSESDAEKSAIYATRARKFAHVLEVIDDILNSEKPSLSMETVSIII